MKALAFDESQNAVYTACYEDGRIYGFSMGSNLRNDINPTKLFNISGTVNPRCMALIRLTNQLAVGHKSGIIAIYDLNSAAPKCGLIRLAQDP